MTILNTITDYYNVIFGIIATAVLGLALMAVILSVIDLISDACERWMYITGMVIGFILGGVIGHSIWSEPETKYEIILDDTYPASKLLNEYEILDKRGDIYTVKLLEDE